MTLVPRTRLAIGRARLGDMAGLLDQYDLTEEQMAAFNEAMMFPYSSGAAMVPMSSEGTIAPDYNVGLRESLTDLLGSQLGGGIPAQRSANRLMQAGEMAVGPLGAANDLSSARSNFGRGNYVEGSLDALVGLLGAAPLVGGMVSKPVKAARRLLFDAPYSNYKIDPDLPARLDELTTVRQTENYVEPKVISPEELSREGYLLNLVGDRTNVGEITRLGGKELDTPIKLDGGRGYMRGEGTGAWASDESVIKKLANKTKKAEGAPVVGTYVAMSGKGSDFANMTREVAMRDFDPSNLLKKDIEDFDEKFRSAKAYKELTEDFPGLGSEKLDEWLDKSGTRRAALFDFMDKTEWRDKGFPNITEARYIIQDPDLRNLPAGNEQFGGQSLALINPEIRTEPTAGLLMPHGTYNTDLAGDYIGGFEMPVPRNLLFPDFYKTRRELGAGIPYDNKSFQSQPILQKTDDEWLDGVMRFLEANRQQ